MYITSHKIVGGLGYLKKCVMWLPNIPGAKEFGFVLKKGINGVSKIKDQYNPATWMLEVTTAAQEEALGVDFTEIYKNSDLYRCVGQLILFGPCLRWQSLVSTVLIGFVGSLQEKQSFD